MKVRRAASLLLDAGHHNAGLYPIPRLFLEAEIVRRRRDRESAEAVSLEQLAIHSLLAADAAKALQKALKDMTE